MTDTLLSQAVSLRERIVRYSELAPCFDAFIDTRTPGSDKKENFTIIGPGVSENPNQYVHIAEPHGFNIGGARQPPGCTNSQHSHDTAEVFYVHTGRWRFDTGEHGSDASVELSQGDLISIPTKLFRGFTNIGSDEGFLWAVLGGDDPGRVLWAPEVFRMAEQYGLVLLEDGMLVDTAAGEAIPNSKKPMPVTCQADIDKLQVLSASELEQCVSRANSRSAAGPFDDLPGISEKQLIGKGALNWDHGFTVSEVSLSPGAVIPEHALQVCAVHFVQDGSVSFCLNEADEESIDTGDTVTIPLGAVRAIRNTGSEPARLVSVYGGDTQPSILWK